MTKISDIYNGIVQLTQTTLADYERLPNPYMVEINTDLFLRKGFGIAIREATKREGDVSCGHYIWDRFYEVTLSHAYYVNENDASGRGEVEVDLLEARELLIKAFRRDIHLSNGVPDVALTIDSDFVSDGGIEYLQGDRTRNIVLRLDLLVTYEDNV